MPLSVLAQTNIESKQLVLLKVKSDFAYYCMPSPVSMNLNSIYYSRLILLWSLWVCTRLHCLFVFYCACAACSIVMKHQGKKKTKKIFHFFLFKLSASMLATHSSMSQKLCLLHETSRSTAYTRRAAYT